MTTITVSEETKTIIEALLGVLSLSDVCHSVSSNVLTIENQTHGVVLKIKTKKNVRLQEFGKHSQYEGNG